MNDNDRINYIYLEVYEDQSCWYKGKPFNGIACYYREDGLLESEVSYTDGIMSGAFKDWDETGRLIYEGSMRNGVYHGECRTLYTNGKLKRVETYRFGVCIASTTWNSDGEILETTKLSSDDPSWKLIRKLGEGEDD